VARSVAIISIMATSLSASWIIIGHNATKRFLATAGIANQALWMPSVANKVAARPHANIILCQPLGVLVCGKHRDAKTSDRIHQETQT